MQPTQTTYKIEFLNSKKGFKKDVKIFKDYNHALKWGKENFENFNIDMIQVNFN